MFSPSVHTHLHSHHLAVSSCCSVPSQRVVLSTIFRTMASHLHLITNGIRHLFTGLFTIWVSTRAFISSAHSPIVSSAFSWLHFRMCSGSKPLPFTGVANLPHPGLVSSLSLCYLEMNKVSINGVQLTKFLFLIFLYRDHENLLIFSQFLYLLSVTLSSSDCKPSEENSISSRSSTALRSRNESQVGLGATQLEFHLILTSHFLSGETEAQRGRVTALRNTGLSGTCVSKLHFEGQPASFLAVSPWTCYLASLSPSFPHL